MPCKLLILRSVNALLKRTSAPSAPALCGCMLMFLAKFFPLSERSGVNVAGLYNTANTTVVHDVTDGTADSRGSKVDGALYRTFWGLQTLFTNPVNVLQPSVWTAMVADVRTVLQRFAQQPVSTSAATLDEGAIDVHAVPTYTENVYYYCLQCSHPDNVREHNPKFLTSPQLFHLQLRDAEFRQHFLLQLIILLHHARHPGKGDGPRQRQMGDLLDLEAMAVEQLRVCGATGAAVADLASTIMSREKHWVEWKAAACPSFEKPPVELALGACTDAANVNTQCMRRPCGTRAWEQTQGRGGGGSGHDGAQRVVEPNAGQPRVLGAGGS